MGTKTSRLEDIRQNLGISRTEMAEAMGIERTYYQHIIAGKGKGNLRLDHLEALLETYGVNPVWVITGKEAMFVVKSHEIVWDKEPTQEQIDILYQNVMKQTEVELSPIQKIKLQLACAQCYYEFPEVKSLEILTVAAKVYLNIIVRNPQVDLNGIFGI